MGRKILVWGGGLIALYLALSHATQGGTLLTTGSGAASTIVKTFQGR